MFDIPFAKPSITAREVSYATDAAANGWGKKCYEYITHFEQAFARYLGAKHAIATSSCTGALHIAMRALGIGDGDEVILPEITWIASAAAVTYERAKPVFVDIDPNSWCIDVTKVEAAITPRTKAIIAVHLYGNLCDMSKLREIADRHKLYLIEDAAEALGSEWQGRKAGCIADVGVFSFHGTKTITTGEGGMFVCQRDDIYEKALLQSNHGRKPSRHTIFWMDEIGVKYKMSNLQAAIGLAQIERIEELVDRKREIFAFYKDALADLDVDLNPENAGDVNSYWLPAVVARAGLSEEKRDAMLEAANAQGIGLRPFFYSLPRFPMFAHLPESPVASRVCRAGLNLPSFHDMTENDLKIVATEVCKGLGT
jgi:perosamine synthetase